MQTFTVTSVQKTDVINVTDLLAGAAVGVERGIAVFSVPHTTAALILCEDDDELRADLIRAAEGWLAPLRPFKHNRKNNPNAEAHILSAFGGTSVTVIVEGGKLALGTYQNLLFIELDGPKEREIRVMVLSA